MIFNLCIMSFAMKCPSGMILKVVWSAERRERNAEQLKHTKRTCSEQTVCSKGGRYRKSKFYFNSVNRPFHAILVLGQTRHGISIIFEFNFFVRFSENFTKI